MVKVFITGFPHCGTTILRKIIGNSDSVLEKIQEQSSVLDAEIDKNKTHVVFKYPYFLKSFHYIIEPKYDHFDKRIFILRNPKFVFSSLNTRFKNTDYFFNNNCNEENHSFAMFEECCEMFDLYRKLNDKKTLAIKYEDLFVDEFKNVEKIFDFVNLKFDRKILLNKRKAFVYSSDQKVIDNNPHLKLRISQINSPFQYSDSESKINLSHQQVESILKSKKVKLVYPNI